MNRSAVDVCEPKSRSSSSGRAVKPLLSQAFAHSFAECPSLHWLGLWGPPRRSQSESVRMVCPPVPMTCTGLCVCLTELLAAMRGHHDGLAPSEPRCSAGQPHEDAGAGGHGSVATAVSRCPAGQSRRGTAAPTHRARGPHPGRTSPPPVSPRSRPPDRSGRCPQRAPAGAAAGHR